MVTPFRGSSSGLSRSALRSTRFVRVFRDVYIPGQTPLDFPVLVDAVCAAIPDAVISHQTAAVLLRLPVQGDGHLHVTRPPGRSSCRHASVRTHRVRLPAADVMALHGRCITTPERVFLDLACRLDLTGAVVLADAVARRVGPGQLARRVRAADTRPGVRRAAEALALADPLADSPAETRTRLILHAAGFTRLRHGRDVSDPAGGWLARPDLADPAAKVAVQYDGRVHFGDDPKRRRADIDRDELLRQHGWQVVVLTGFDLRDPDRMVAKVAAAYDRAGR